MRRGRDRRDRRRAHLRCRARLRRAAVMTRADHASPAPTASPRSRPISTCDTVINLQGDEPQIDPAALDLLAELLASDPAATWQRSRCRLPTAKSYLSPNVVKVVCDDRGRALYFSRSPIPMVRDGEPDFSARPARFLQHLGVYAYRRDFLLKIAATPPHPLEQS